MEWLLKPLKYLSEYGLIDIIFGLGIGGFILKFFRKKSVKELPVVNISAKFSHNSEHFYKSKYQIHISNTSAEPLYIYKVLFKRRNNFFSKNELPIIHENVNITRKGYYEAPIMTKNSDVKLPQLLNSNEEKLITYIPFQEDLVEKKFVRNNLEILKSENKCGIIEIHLILGGNSKIIKTKI